LTASYVTRESPLATPNSGGVDRYAICPETGASLMKGTFGRGILGRGE
jgi:hypothetical protein